MFNPKYLALVAGLTCLCAQAANTPDDFFIEKIRFIHDHAENNAAYNVAAQQLTQKVRPSDGAELAALGRAFMRYEDYGNALPALISATRAAPRNADALADLSFVSAMYAHDCQRSRAAYDQAIALNPAVAELRHVRHGRALCAD